MSVAIPLPLNANLPSEVLRVAITCIEGEGLQKVQKRGAELVGAREPFVAGRDLINKTSFVCDGVCVENDSKGRRSEKCLHNSFKVSTMEFNDTKRALVLNSNQSAPTRNQDLVLTNKLKRLPFVWGLTVTMVYSLALSQVYKYKNCARAFYIIRAYSVPSQGKKNKIKNISIFL